MKKVISGLAMHVHHNILFEYCWDYNERVGVIKRNKPKNEQKTRLKLFKMLPDEAINEMPEPVKKAYANRRKAYADCKKAYTNCKKAYTNWKKANADWKKANADWEKATTDLQKATANWKDKEAWHTKWCGCQEWDGKEIKFT
jgi:hypothetical protein